MMIDSIRLAGEQAYLRVPGTAGVNAAPSAGAGPAVSLPLSEGMQLDITSIDLLMEGNHLERLLQHQGNPLVSFAMRKEMFPGLFSDPYRHRVHTVSGYEDLQRGTHERIEVIEIDGYPTLVSTDAGPCVWKSAAYRIPQSNGQPALFTAAAWDMGSSRLAAREGLAYHLSLRAWAESGPSEIVMLAGSPTRGATPATPRWRQAPPSEVLFKATTFQVILEAHVNQDTAFVERHGSEGVGHSLGRPILRAVNLLERVDGSFEYRSLQEVLAAADAVKRLEDPLGNVRSVAYKLPFRASLGKDEQVSLEIRAGAFTRVEARLDGTLSLRADDPDRSRNP